MESAGESVMFTGMRLRLQRVEMCLPSDVSGVVGRERRVYLGDLEDRW